ncbi:unnamed protein product, partial [Laminaria digitata]
VSSKRGDRCSTEDAHCLELFGLGSGLAHGAPRGACSWSAARRLNIVEGILQRLAGASHSSLPQAVLQEWRRGANRERLEGVVEQNNPARGSAFAFTGDGKGYNRCHAVQPTSLTTPSDVLTASSVRLMLSMALAVRRRNPEVLQAISGSLLELLLETPPLVLAPLHLSPTSIEATTFRKVSDFCSELMRSSDHAEREPALGLYLALAVSRGEVSCLLEVVRCLLDRYQHTCQDQPNNVGENGAPLPSVDSMTIDAPDVPPGEVELEAGWSSKQRARVSAVLDRLANHRLHVHLWQNGGLAPGPLADGPFGWEGALRTLASDVESTRRDRRGNHQKQTPCISDVSQTAVFVLSHLDRLGEHYSGWTGSKAQEGGHGASPLADEETLSVPFCFDLTPATFRHLIALVETFSGSVGNGGDDDEGSAGTNLSEGLGTYVLCASLRLLNVNVGILLGRGLGVVEFGGESLRESLLRCLLGLVEEDSADDARAGYRSSGEKSSPDVQSGRAMAARSALRLLVDGMDLFYPTQPRQACLLFSYLRAFEASSGFHPPVAHALTMELLARVSSLRFLRSLETTGNADHAPGTSTEAECLVPGLVFSKYAPLSTEIVGDLSKTLVAVCTIQSVRDVRLALNDGAAGHTSAPVAENVWRGDTSTGCAGKLGLAVLSALDTILKLRYTDAVPNTKSEPGEGRDFSEVVNPRPKPLLEFLLLVLDAANDVLDAAASTPTPTEPMAVLSDRVVDTLRNGLIGTLLPSCLASILTLLEEDKQREWSRSGASGPLLTAVEGRLVQVTRTMGLLVTQGWRCVGMEKEPECQVAMPAEDELVWRRVVLGVGSCGSEGSVSETCVESAKHYPKASPLYKYFIDARNGTSCKTTPDSRAGAAWLVRLERLFAALGASVARQLMMGEPQDSEEKDSAQCLRSPLLVWDSAAALGDSVTAPSSADAGKQTDPGVLHRQGGGGKGCAGASALSSLFMMRLCRHSASRESRALSVVMRRVVLEDRGHDQGTNEAIWAAAVAAVHHAGLEGELARIVRAELTDSDNAAAGTIDAKEGVPLTVSPALTRAWRCVQQARFRLEGGALRDRERTLVMRRAQFLVSLKPWASTTQEGALESASGDVISRALTASELVLDFLLRTVEIADTQVRGGGGDGTRGDDVEPRTTAREGDPDALVRTVEVQSVRAVARSRGYLLAAQLLNRRYSHLSAIDILQSVTDGLAMRCLGPALANRKGKATQAAGGTSIVSGAGGGLENTSNAPTHHKGANREGLCDTGRLHFMVGVECCDARSRSALVESVARFLRQCFLVLGKGHITDRGTAAGMDGGRDTVVVQALRAVSMDYGVDDHDILYRSQLLPRVLTLLDDGGPSVSEAASVALQALARCVLPEQTRSVGSAFFHQSVANGLEGGRGLKECADGGDPNVQPRGQTPKRGRGASCTPFQTAFFSAVRLKVQEIAGRGGEKLAAALCAAPVEATVRPEGGCGSNSDFDEGGKDNAGCAGGVRKTATEKAAAAQILALAHGCCQVEFGRKEFSTAATVRALLRMVLVGEPEMRGWALRVCRETLPWQEPSVVDDQFRYIVRERQPSFQGSFVSTCLLLIGKISGVWGSLASISSDHAHSPAEGSVGASDRPLSGADSMLDMLLAPPGWRVACARVSSREAFSLSSELASLLHALVERTSTTGATNAGAREDHPSIRSPAWEEEIARVTRAWLCRASPLVESLQRQMVLREDQLGQEAEMACKHSIADRNCGAAGATEEKEQVPVSMDDLDRLVAALCVLGGQFGGLYPGAKVLCRVPSRDNASDPSSRRGSQAFGSQGRRDGLENAAVEEATVLRLRLSRAQPQGADVPEINNEYGVGPTEVSTGQGRVDGAVRRSVQEPRPVFSSRLIALPSPGSVRPLDVYDGLVEEAYSGVVPPAAVARETAGDNQRRLQQQQQQQQRRRQQRQNQQQQDMPVRIPTAGTESMFRGQGREWAGLRRRSSSPDIGEAVGVPSMASAHVRPPAPSAASQQTSTGCGEWVTVGIAREDPRAAPHVVTVPVETVTLVRMGTPSALTKALVPYVEELLPGLRALLEGDTEFRGPTHARGQQEDQRCVVESAHPYEPGESRVWSVVMEGANTIEITFDPKSLFAKPGDQIMLSWRTPWGSGGHRRLCPCIHSGVGKGDCSPAGDDGSQTWPGVGEEPPLVVVAEAVKVRFVSASATPGVEEEKSGARVDAPRAWGFRFTAKGREVQRKAPPSQSASLAGAILCDLRARTVKSLAVLLEHNDASTLLSPLVPTLAKVVLGAAPQVALVAGHAGTSSVVAPPAKLEQRLAQAYALLHEQPKPPSMLPEDDLVVRSESGAQADGSPTNDLAAFRASTLRGGNGLASILRPQPSRDISTSRNAAGQGRVKGGEGAPPLNGGIQHARSPTEGAWPRRYVVCIGGVEAFESLIRDERSASRAVRLRHGAKVLVVAQERDWLKLIYDPLGIFQPASTAATRSRTGGTDDRRPRSASPAHVWARQREDDTIFLAPEVLVGSEHVVTEASDAVGVTEGSLVAMTSGESDEEYGDVWDGEGLISGKGHDGAEWESTHHEEGTRRGNGARRCAFANDSSQDLRGHVGNDLWGFTVDTLCAAASRFGVSALLTVATRRRGEQGQLISEHLFGSVECLWQILRHTNAIEQGNLQSTAMAVLKQCVLECVGGEGGAALGRSLVGHALDALRECAAFPGPRAVACVLETTHPYQNKMDVEWNVHMSGASRIKVVFDPRSRTALDCDWLSIVQEPDGVSAGQPLERRGDSGRYHGRGGRENFPGFGGRAPLWLKGDRFVARFHSGLNTTDWGVRFTAYGFLDDRNREGCDSSHAQRAVPRASSCTLDGESEGEKAGVTVRLGAKGINRAPRFGDAKTRAATMKHARALDVELCCWLLETLSHEGRKVPELAACLCDEHALGVYQECLQVFSQRRQLRVLRLMTCVIAEARVPSTYRTLPQPLATAFPASDNSRDGNLAVRPSAGDADAALEVILAQITTQQTIEGDPLTMSPYLQALVQCAARLYAFPGCAGEPLDSRLVDEPDTNASRPATPERDRQVVRTVEVAPGTETCVLVSPERSRRVTGRLLRTGPSVDAVREVAAVWAALSDFFQGTTPTRMLLKEFLPILTEAFSVTVQSTHPFDVVAQHRVIAVPGATGMLARFDHRTETREDDKVIIRAPRRHSTAGSSETAVPSQLVGSLASQPTKAATSAGDLLRDGEELSFFGLVGGTDEEGLPLVSVGDLVVRGPDWAFGDEDFGAEQEFPPEDKSSALARVGVVIALEKWDKCDGAGARVRWGDRTDVGAAGAVGGGQEPGRGFEALYSVRSPAHVRVVKRGGPDRARRPVIAAGGALELNIVPAGAKQGASGGNEPGEDAGGGGSVGKRSHTQCIRFDGESTYVDLPRYRGMRLEGDFTLEVWAWLDPGAACDGKPKCVFSRALDQSLHHNRHASTGDSTVSEKGAKGAPPVVATTPGGPVPGGGRVVEGDCVPSRFEAGKNLGVGSSGANDGAGEMAAARMDTGDANVQAGEEGNFLQVGGGRTGDGEGVSAAHSSFLDKQPLSLPGETHGGGDDESADRGNVDEGELFLLEDDEEEEEEEVRWDNGRANSYETGARGKFAISFADAVPGVPRDLVASSATNRSISIRWSPPVRLGRPPLRSYIVYCDDVEIASVAGDTLKFTHTNRMRGWPYSYSVAARGAAGASLCCPPMVAMTATKDDRRTQLALWVGGQGEIQFAMGNERGKGVILGAGQCQEGVWTHLAVTMEGRKVSVFVDGDRRATGKFVGRRLCPGSLSPATSNGPEQPSAEPLRLGSRGDHDYWRGQLCGMRVWGVASLSCHIRRKMGSIPSASLVRAPPPLSFKVTVPETQEEFSRLRVDAPLPDPPEGVLGAPGATKAYYEVLLRSGGCMQIGWALPSSCPSSRNLGVGDDECSWAVDGLRAMKWHGNTSLVSSPYAHGVPYGKSWKWGAGDVIGCAVDFGAGAMSFSHNGCNLGNAFVREQVREIGRYRVIAPNGLKCRAGIDVESAVVETFSPGTVLQVSQVETLLSGGTWRLRTAEGWVAERAADDPDKFFLERLEQDTCEFAGAGPERCVFVDGLRSPGTASGGEEGCDSRVPHALCKEIVVGERYAEVVVEASLPDVDGDDSDLAVEHPLTCSLLANSVEVGDADAVTFSVELFVPAERPAASATAGGIWEWGVVVGDLDVYLSTQRRFTVKESDNGGGYEAGGAIGAPGDTGAVGRGGNEEEEAGAKSMHIVVEGPTGFIHALPVSSAFRGRWMTLKIVARRSGESVLVCTPNADQVHVEHDRPTGTSINVRLGVADTVSDFASVADRGAEHQVQQRQLRCTFSNPCFFRGVRLGCIGLYSERTGPFCPENSVDFPFRARHAVVLLGSAEDTPPLAFPRLLELERLMAVEHKRRLVEPPAWPLLIFARRLRRVWSGEVPAYVCRTSNIVDGGPSTTARDPGVPALPTPISSACGGTGSPTASCTAQDAGRALSPTLTVWKALLLPGRVAFGSAIHFSRFGTGTTANLAGSDGILAGDDAVQRRCVTAWEHPALQTPARFEAVPLPPTMSSQAVAGRGLWAWAPVPRSEAFLAMGLVFTAGPEPPPVTDVRCVRRELVKGAEGQKCKRVTLQRTTKRRQEANSSADQDSHCNEILIVKEMGVCVPKEGSAWGLSPRVVVGDAGERHGLHQPRWDGLMPTLSGTAGESVVINLGHSPFRHPMDGYLPVSEVVHADARFVLQVYKESERMWRDVQ